ncbi:DUF4377 domain-containing protein [uncultured Chitinophaga sp.]|uniref:DUF4377 domain-containing protein n=1 Tax=uncultured Chitinophaga sp. TaxID=339340 RepID=UPI0025D1D45F|nr:DUF4377 domain-containing protein [uncultured Chitinophaga sp.]
MKSRLIRWILPAMLFAACDHPPKPAGVSDTIETGIATGFYEDTLPSASSPGRLVRLNVSRSGEVRMVTDYLNYTPEIIQIGSLLELDSSKLRLSLVTVGSGNPVTDTMLFRFDNGNMTYLGNNFGSEGFTLKAKEKPAPAPKDLVFWVKSEQDCDLGPGFGKTTCYEVQYGDRPVGQQEPWETLSEPITGFNFEKGQLFKLKVTRIPRDTMVRDRGPYEYKLLQVLEQKASK